MPRRKPAVPTNEDQLWRKYHGSVRYHRYGQGSFANWRTQIALCGRRTRTGIGSYSALDPVSPHVALRGPICRNCERLFNDKKGK